ncbi:Rho GTPase-activating protein domain and Rho GTPase activation protein domain-containing protein [Strongyloides ratti]|uniref:Rho GTPase-activating protein domain and Rho GTPase activation protein domain-containing protein n=1 Tax=Strongyloides ratti TaxID=34506 RepID=A0A090MYY6_STRRB|nr:Rho GTPase-activating protein domain and Rho GTPase activation protein domain-containing protein [Strongyloides ratti]CEF67999.1 Rho GTPase-activating protein domain and Rho GTPase activation protein domain-containing protein [Strongyloides ratti]
MSHIDITLEEEENKKVEMDCLISLNSIIDSISFLDAHSSKSLSKMNDKEVNIENTIFDNNSTYYDDGKQLILYNLTTNNKISPEFYSELIVQPAMQYFLATVCDLKIDDKKKQRLGVRYVKTPEVQKLLLKLIKKKKISKKNELDTVDPNVIISVLKEILSQFPGGIFADDNEEFISVTLSSSLDYALLYVSGLIASLPLFLRQFTYLICKSLNNLAKQSAGSLTDSYTDIVLLFTPVLFPTAIKDMSRFLRASRISLILIDLCDKVFKQFMEIDEACENDDDFFKKVVQSLSKLANGMEVSDSETDYESMINEYNESLDVIDTVASSVQKSKNDYYQFTYVEQ